MSKTKWIASVMWLTACSDGGATAGAFDAGSEANTDMEVEDGGSARPTPSTAPPMPSASVGGGGSADSGEVPAAGGAPGRDSEAPPAAGSGGSPNSDDYIVNGHNLSAPGMPCNPTILCGGNCPHCPCDCTVQTVLPGVCPSSVQASCIKQCGGSESVSHTCL